MDIRLGSCSGPHGQIRRTLWKLFTYTSFPSHCAGSDCRLPDAGIPMLSAACRPQVRWWYGGPLCSLLRSCHGDLWWYSYSAHPHFLGTDMWNLCTISGSACPPGSPALAYSQILYGACLAFFTEFTIPLGDAGFGNAILCGDAFVGASLFFMEADNLLFEFGRVVLWHNRYLFLCDFYYILLATPVTTLL